jgi:hypothetical protein
MLKDAREPVVGLAGVEQQVQFKVQPQRTVIEIGRAHHRPMVVGQRDLWAKPTGPGFNV